jgi:hypothetical protein
MDAGGDPAVARAHRLEAAAGGLHAAALLGRLRPGLEPLRARLGALQARAAALPVPEGSAGGLALDMARVLEKHRQIRARGTDRGGADAAEVGALEREGSALRAEALAMDAMLRGTDGQPMVLGRWVRQSPAWAGLLAEAAALCEAAEALGGLRGPATSAHLPNVQSTDDNDVLLHWTKAHATLPEYRRAAGAICVAREWMADTKLLRHIRQVADAHGAEIAAIRKDVRAFERTLEATIERGYGLKGGKAARGQKDLLSGHNIFGKVTQVYNTLEGWKKPFFVHGWRLILAREADVGAIVSKLSEVVDHSMHCPHVQVKAFQLVLSHCARLPPADADADAA